MTLLVSSLIFFVFRGYCLIDLGRAHSVISTFLPAHYLPSLPSPDSRTAFLQALSSGQLLCLAYNPCVRKSSKPWGYISKDAIHDILALEEAQAAGKDEDKDSEKTKKGWTFRRTDNLRLWAGYVLFVSSIELG
jgi:hypothetical protein